MHVLLLDAFLQSRLNDAVRSRLEPWVALDPVERDVRRECLAALHRATAPVDRARVSLNHNKDLFFVVVVKKPTP